MYKKGTGNDKQGKDAGNRTFCPCRNFSQAIKHSAVQFEPTSNKQLAIITYPLGLISWSIPNFYSRVNNSKQEWRKVDDKGVRVIFLVVIERNSDLSLVESGASSNFKVIQLFNRVRIEFSTSFSLSFWFPPLFPVSSPQNWYVFPWVCCL